MGTIDHLATDIHTPPQTRMVYGVPLVPMQGGLVMSNPGAFSGSVCRHCVFGPTRALPGSSSNDMSLVPDPDWTLVKNCSLLIRARYDAPGAATRDICNKVVYWRPEEYVAYRLDAQIPDYVALREAGVEPPAMDKPIRRKP